MISPTSEDDVIRTLPPPAPPVRRSHPLLNSHSSGCKRRSEGIGTAEQLSYRDGELFRGSRQPLRVSLECLCFLIVT